MQQDCGTPEVTAQPTARMLRLMEPKPTFPTPKQRHHAAFGRPEARASYLEARLPIATLTVAALLAAALLAVAPGPARAGSSAIPASAVSADTSLAAWRHAVGQPDGEAIADLTVFPFLFEGHLLSRPAFVAQVVPALFKPAARRCLQRAQPLPEGDRLIVTCAPYGYVFGLTPSGRRLIDFFVDTP